MLLILTLYILILTSADKLLMNEKRAAIAALLFSFFPEILHGSLLFGGI